MSANPNPTPSEGRSLLSKGGWSKGSIENEREVITADGAILEGGGGGDDSVKGYGVL